MTRNGASGCSRKPSARATPTPPRRIAWNGRRWDRSSAGSAPASPGSAPRCYPTARRNTSTSSCISPGARRGCRSRLPGCGVRWQGRDDVKIGLWMSSVVCAHVLAAAAHAQQYSYRGAYAGGAVGPSTMSFEGDSLAVGSATASTLSTEQRSTAFKGYGGYRFKPHFAAQGGFGRFGNFPAPRTLAAPPPGPGGAHFTGIGGP